MGENTKMGTKGNSRQCFLRKCLDVVTIIIEKAEMDGKDLILRGKCDRCGIDVCRVVEPEDE